VVHLNISDKATLTIFVVIFKACGHFGRTLLFFAHLLQQRAFLTLLLSNPFSLLGRICGQFSAKLYKHSALGFAGCGLPITNFKHANTFSHHKFLTLWQRLDKPAYMTLHLRCYRRLNIMKW